MSPLSFRPVWFSLLIFCSVLLISTLACGTHAKAPVPAQPPTAGILQVQNGITVRYSAPWTESGYKYGNAKELVLQPSSSDKNGARILITTERRLSVADADRRLLDISHLRPGKPSFYAIGGWPAVEIRFREPLPTVVEGGEDQHSGARPNVERAMVSVAADTNVLDFDIWLTPETGAQVLNHAIAIAKSASFAEQGNPDETRRRIQKLARLAASGSDRASTAVQQGGPGMTGSEPPPFRGEPLGGLTASAPIPNPPGSTGIGSSELEIAASANGQQIVIGANNSLTFSKDGGKSFASGSPGAFSPNDPTVTRGFSGNFYLGGIAFASSPLLCSDVVSRSTNGGATFTSVGFSMVCPPNAGDSNVCFPDQPHIAADPFQSAFSSAPADQLYAVWRNMTQVAHFFAEPAPSCADIKSSVGFETSSITCSTNNGVTWTSSSPLAIPGGGDHPRVAVGADSKVYAITLSGSSILLTRFSSCASGLVPEAGFPVTVASDASVSCPVPGLDRCNGDGLTSQMVATDPQDAKHLFVTYARSFGSGELIVSRESHDAGLTFAAEVALSPPTIARRFMPWSCVAMGTVFAGWYDRAAAIAGPTNDLTNYLVGGAIIANSTPLNLTVNPDPQCASAWAGGADDPSDSESCQPHPPPEPAAGLCLKGDGTGSGSCVFSNPVCPKGESCMTGIGVPKYGDYNGIACSNDSVIAAWASATSPGKPPLPPVSGISIFSAVIPLGSFAPPTYDELVVNITTGDDGLQSSSEVIASITGEGSFCLKSSDSNKPDGICANGSGAVGWPNGDVVSQTFALPSPGPLPTTMTINLVQGTCTGCTSDNWNIEDISVFAQDHTHTLPLVTLLSLFGTKPVNDNMSCVARLKDLPNSPAATFSLGSPPNSHKYAGGGKADGSTTKCHNNGD